MDGHDDISVCGVQAIGVCMFGKVCLISMRPRRFGLVKCVRKCQMEWVYRPLCARRMYTRSFELVECVASVLSLPLV
jgi:hypothetical protein